MGLLEYCILLVLQEVRSCAFSERIWHKRSTTASDSLLSHACLTQQASLDSAEVHVKDRVTETFVWLPCMWNEVCNAADTVCLTAAKKVVVRFLLPDPAQPLPACAMP